ncbi:M1 family aminopeptidase [Olivibacter domesticus]|nr:M1 family aminopeptidase [Olivibacter domesticus]
MKLLFTYCLITLLLCWSNPIISQEQDVAFTGNIHVSGSVQPIANASIQLKKGKIGTSSNADGRFILNVPSQFLPDSLVVSCVGFETLVVPLTASNKERMQLTLHPIVVKLGEVMVNKRDGLAIMKEVIARIPQNYDTTNIRLTASYREYIRLKDDTINYNESLLDIYKTFHTTKTNQNQIKILKGQKLPSDDHGDPRFYNWIKNITNTAYSSLSEDVQPYTEAPRSFMNANNFRYYNFDYVETIQKDTSNLMVISFSPKRSSKRALIEGKLYIEEATLAIVMCEWRLTPAGVRYINRHGKGGIGYTIMSAVLRASMDFRGIKTVINYKKHGDKWYLSAINRYWDVLIDSRKRNMKAIPWKGHFSMLVTDINTKDVKPFTNGVISPASSLNNEIRRTANRASWEDATILSQKVFDTLKNTETNSAKHDDHKPDSDIIHISNRANGFTYADTLRGMLSAPRTCYDVTFYHLDVDVDLASRAIKGNNKIKFKVVTPFKRMQVDLYANMPIDKILFKEQSLPYERVHNAVFIDFPEVQQEGTLQELSIFYKGTPQVPDLKLPMYGGFLWDKDALGNPWVQMVCQGSGASLLWDKDALGNPWVQMVCQGSGASLWWPNKDHQSDEPDSMRIWITVPQEYTEISNGVLAHKTPLANQKMRFEWKITYPINNYNVSFCIGKYAHFDDHYIDNNNDTLKLNYYVMPYHLQLGKQLFQQVKPMLKIYEKYFGKYPFPRDGFTLLESPYPMEHQSGVCIGKAIVDSSSLIIPRVMWHEVAHEWWGNAVTSKDIADMWIHEAFATYAESLMVEESYGKAAAIEYINNQRNEVLNHEPVIGVYDVNHIHYNIEDMYTKGSLLLHTFRSVLNDDERWFSLLKNIQAHFRYQTITSDELIDYICRQTGRNYRPIFDQYLRYTGIPTLQYSLLENNNNLTVRYRWQADHPNFDMPIKISVAENQFDTIYPSSEWKTVTLKNMNEDNFEVDEEGFYIKSAQIE